MRRKVCAAGALPPGGAVEFEAYVRGELRRCFAVRDPASGGLFAYLNVCAHRNQPVVVDAAPFDGAGRVECRAHGAFYDPATGLCVKGPCEGASLVAVPLEQDGDEVWAIDDDAVDDSVYADDEEPADQ